MDRDNVMIKLFPTAHHAQVERQIKMFRVGFTGSREGMSPHQKARVGQLLLWLRPTCVHHGCCIGADAEFDQLAVGHKIWRIGHPCNLKTQQASAVIHSVETLLPEQPPLDRNHDIVDVVDVLLACPQQPEEILRSGTWATVRYCRKQYPYKLVLIKPNGSLVME